MESLGKASKILFITSLILFTPFWIESDLNISIPLPAYIYDFFLIFGFFSLVLALLLGLIYIIFEIIFSKKPLLREELSLLLHPNLRKKILKLEDTCILLVHEYESTKLFPNSCYEEIKSYIHEYCLHKRYHIDSNKELNFSIKANDVLRSITFDLLTSGEYHIYRGQLSPVGTSNNLMHIFVSTVEYAYNNNLFNEEERANYYADLSYLISTVG